MSGAAGVIGVGYWGRKHAEEYLKLGRRVYVADLSEKNRKECGEKNAVEKSFKDYAELLALPEVGYVSVCTPNATHYQIAKDALLAGKHVLVEKPFVLSVKEGKELAKISREKKLTVAVGHVFRFNNAVNHARNVFKSKAMGKPYLLKLKWTNLEPVFGDRDVIFDLGPHPFDIIHYLLDAMPEEISCIGGAYRQDRTESAFINCKVGATLVNIEVSWITPIKERSLALICEKKSLFSDVVKQTMNVYDNETKAYANVDINPNNTIQDELRAFLQCADQGQVSVADAEIGTSVVHLLQVAEESMKKGVTLKVPKI